MAIFKRRDFARWQARERLLDDALRQAVQDMDNGLIDADLGGLLYKQRIARPGYGKRGGYHTLIAARTGERHIFLHGFQKNAKANITLEERKALQFAGQIFLNLSRTDIAKAVQAGILIGVECEQQTD